MSMTTPVTLRQNLDNSAGAIFGGQAEEYRYLLWRGWMTERQITFIMLNPSTADENTLDPTLRRCWSFAEKWGFGRMEIVNLFSFRATDPKVMKQARSMGVDVIGERNDYFILDSARRADTVVCAWGANDFGGRGDMVTELIAPHVRRLFCLKRTKSGAPGHPLYVHGDSQLSVFRDGGATDGHSRT
jgi:hypothetical protein